MFELEAKISRIIEWPAFSDSGNSTEDWHEECNFWKAWKEIQYLEIAWNRNYVISLFSQKYIQMNEMCSI